MNAEGPALIPGLQDLPLPAAAGSNGSPQGHPPISLGIPSHNRAGRYSCSGLTARLGSVYLALPSVSHIPSVCLYRASPTGLFAGRPLPERPSTQSAVACLSPGGFAISPGQLSTPPIV